MRRYASAPRTHPVRSQKRKMIKINVANGKLSHQKWVGMAEWRFLEPSERDIKLEILWTEGEKKKRPKRKQHRYSNQAWSKIRPRAKSWKLLFCQWLLSDHRKRRKGISILYKHFPLFPFIFDILLSTILKRYYT